MRFPLDFATTDDLRSSPRSKLGGRKCCAENRIVQEARHVASGDISKFLESKRGKESLPMDEFVRLNRRDSLADFLSAAR
jgi:hypothetical protein